MEWTLDLPPKREFKPKPLSSDSTRPKKVLHLTDIHLDLYYSPNGEVNCHRTLCCRAVPISEYINIVNKHCEH